MIVYGASGYTGRLICEYLREYNVPFIAVGRDATKVQESINHVPGLDTVDHEVARGRAHRGGADRAVLRCLGRLQHRRAVHLLRATRWSRRAWPAGAHYLDTTGEQDWVIDAETSGASNFAEQGLLLAPGVAQMYTTGEIAANLALETPGMDTLDILVLWKGFPTYASTQTIFTILKADWFHLVNNEYVAWDHTATRECVVPGQHGTALTVPWGGTCHPVWFKNDPRVSTVTVAAACSTAR